MSIIFNAKQQEERNLKDNSLKLGRIYHYEELFPADNDDKKFRVLITELTTINGLQLELSVKKDFYSVRLEASRVEDEEALRQVVSELCQLSNKRITTKIIGAIESLTHYNFDEEKAATQQCCICC